MSSDPTTHRMIALASRGKTRVMRQGETRACDVTYDEVLAKHLKVMDASAIALARDNNLPIIVFSLDDPGGFSSILQGKGTYTTVHA